jgi:hypothetical protein
MKTNKGLVAYALAQVGRPYWFGTFGNKATSALYSAKKKQYPGEYIENDYKSQYGERVHDCIGLIKGYLWSDTATLAPVYNRKQDVGADRMRELSDAKPIKTIPETPGVLVFAPGHVGVYVGDGYVVEAYSHARGVIKTKLAERNFDAWGYCPWIEYQKTDNKKTLNDVVKEVVAGLWGNGVERRRKLMAAGYDYETVQNAVNAYIAKLNKKDLGKIARDVIKGVYGNGAARKKNLASLGLSVAEIERVQELVNKILTNK